MTLALGAIPGDGVVAPHSIGDAWQIRAELSFSGNYAAGGDSLEALLEAIFKQQGSNSVIWVDVQGNSGGYVIQYAYGTGKLLVYQTGAALKGAFEELPAGAYPAALTSGKFRVFALAK